jgi:hypothetical protein
MGLIGRLVYAWKIQPRLDRVDDALKRALTDAKTPNQIDEAELKTIIDAARARDGDLFHGTNQTRHVYDGAVMHRLVQILNAQPELFTDRGAQQRAIAQVKAETQWDAAAYLKTIDGTNTGVFGYSPVETAGPLSGKVPFKAYLEASYYQTEAVPARDWGTTSRDGEPGALPKLVSVALQRPSKLPGQAGVMDTVAKETFDTPIELKPTKHYNDNKFLGGHDRWHTSTTYDIAGDFNLGSQQVNTGMLRLEMVVEINSRRHTLTSPFRVDAPPYVID